MSDAYVVAAVRTPIGRIGGALKDVRPDDLAALVLRRLAERVPAERVEDVIMGCANQAGEDNRNVARMALLLADYPVSVPGYTVNRLCASGLQAVVNACQSVAHGDAEVVIAGGVESMTRSPWVMPKTAEPFARGNRTMYDTTLGWRMVNPAMAERYPAISNGETAEVVAGQWGVSREAQDLFALRSQQNAARAIAAGLFTAEIVPVPLGGKEPKLFTVDEHPRADITLEKLAALKPVFKEGGTVTAGNSSGMNDGASGVTVVSEEQVKALGLKPLARFVGWAAAGVDPSCMGIGPVPAVQKLLARTGVGMAEIGLVELNEAFAAQAVACVRELRIDPERVNVNGGAIALGHPLGSTGCRLVVTLVHEMQRRRVRYGLATLCIGVGQGLAALFERCD